MKASYFLSAALAVVGILGAHASAQTILIMDSFDDGVLGTNTTTSIGTGFTFTQPGSAGAASETGGNLEFAVNGGGTRGFVLSNDAFALPDGFTLEFDYSIPSGGNPSNTLNVGLVDDVTADLDILFAENTTTDALGFAARPRNGTVVPGLVQIDGGVLNDNLDSTQVIPGSGQQDTTAATNVSVLLSVDADSNYSFSVNGAAASTGVLSGFDLTQDYSIFIGAQGLVDNPTIGSVTLTALAAETPAIPEPSSLALLGIAGLGLISRRRRR